MSGISAMPSMYWEPTERIRRRPVLRWLRRLCRLPPHAEQVNRCLTGSRLAKDRAAETVSKVNDSRGAGLSRMRPEKLSVPHPFAFFLGERVGYHELILSVTTANLLTRYFREAEAYLLT